VQKDDDSREMKRGCYVENLSRRMLMVPVHDVALAMAAVVIA
jgi:hypothetical protein